MNGLSYLETHSLREANHYLLWWCIEWTKKVHLAHLSIPLIIHHPPKPLTLHSDQPYFMVHFSNLDLLFSPYTHYSLPRPNNENIGTRRYSHIRETPRYKVLNHCSGLHIFVLLRKAYPKHSLDRQCNNRVY